MKRVKKRPKKGGGKKRRRYYVTDYAPYSIPSAQKVFEGMKELHRRRRYPRNKVRLIVLTMLSGAGLRRSELAKLNMGHVLADDKFQPKIILPGNITKRKKRRHVPLIWLMKGGKGVSLPYIRAWAAMRRAMGAKARDPFVCSLDAGREGKRLTPAQIRVYAIGAMRVGGFWEPGFTAHTLRHFFATYAINNAQIGIVAVKQALGHSSLSVTDRYVHLTPDRVVEANIFESALQEAGTDANQHR